MTRLRYEAAYATAITAIGKVSAGPEEAHGISVKLSALSPRYEATQEQRVWEELYPRLLRLAQLAAQADINFTLDAEEAGRLVLSLKLLDRLAREPSLGSWRGLGLAVQAYQKRGPRVIAALEELAHDSGRRLTVRLVKGAYWGQRDQARPGRGPPRLPGLHHQAGHRPFVSGLRQGADRRGTASLFPVRHPQCPHARGGVVDGGRHPHRASTPARHGRGVV